MKKLVLIGLILLSGCNLYKVTDKEDGGIPFFSHEIIEIVTDTYQEKFYEIKAEIVRGELVVTKPETTAKSKKTTHPKKEKDEKRNDVLSTILCYSDENTAIELNNFIGDEELSFLDKLNAFKEATSNDSVFREKPFPIIDILNNNTETETETEAEAEAKKGNPSIPKKEGDLDLILISKTRTNRVQPRSKTYYINVRKAASGTTDGTITLNANGTLASAAASTSEELVGQIVDALPIGDVLSSLLLPSDEEMEEMLSDTTEDPTPKTKKLPVKSFKLTLTPIIRTYEVTHESNLNETDKTFEGLKITETRGDVTKPEEKAKVDEKQEIKLSGTVTLPKADKEDK